MRGHIRVVFFCYFELICWHIYVSHTTCTQYLKKGHTHFYIYEVAFISHTYIILRVINVSSPMPEKKEEKKIPNARSFKSQCLSSSDSTTSWLLFLHVMPLQTPQAEMDMTPFFLQQPACTASFCNLHDNYSWWTSVDPQGPWDLLLELAHTHVHLGLMSIHSHWGSETCSVEGSSPGSAGRRGVHAVQLHPLLEVEFLVWSLLPTPSLRTCCCEFLPM